MGDQLPDSGRTELGLATARGMKEEFLRLIKAGHDPQGQDSYLDTPLHLAALFGHLDLIKILIKEHHVDKEIHNWEGWTPLACAVSRGNITCVKYLLKSGADGNWTSPHGWQLLHVAAWNNQDAMVRWLGQRGARSMAETDHSCRPFDLTRPGTTRRSVFQAMQIEKDKQAGH